MDWEHRLTQLWATIENQEEADFLAQMDTMVSELPPHDPVGIFEKAAAFDSTGHPDLAVPLYKDALSRGLSEERRRRAIIQMASSVRNLGRPAESVQLLEEEKRFTSDHLDDAVDAFLALALADVGREREAVSIALNALARHLPRYNRSLANYAQQLGTSGPSNDQSPGTGVPRKTP